MFPVVGEPTPGVREAKSPAFFTRLAQLNEVFERLSGGCSSPSAPRQRSHGSRHLRVLFGRLLAGVRFSRPTRRVLITIPLCYCVEPERRAIARTDVDSFCNEGGENRLPGRDVNLLSRQVLLHPVTLFWPGSRRRRVRTSRIELALLLGTHSPLHHDKRSLAIEWVLVSPIHGFPSIKTDLPLEPPSNSGRRLNCAPDTMRKSPNVPQIIALPRDTVKILPNPSVPFLKVQTPRSRRRRMPSFITYSTFSKYRSPLTFMNSGSLRPSISSFFSFLFELPGEQSVPACHSRTARSASRLPKRPEPIPSYQPRETALRRRRTVLTSRGLARRSQPVVRRLLPWRSAQ